MASVSQAEAINFGNAVQKKAYEKKAQKVDTFVQSETAEQKLARSDKMQTAKALESIASLGSTYLDSTAKAAEKKTQEMRSQIEDYVTNALEEVRTGTVDAWTKSQYVDQMPVALHMEMARAVAKRKYLADSATFNEAVAANPNLLLKESAADYDKLITDTFNYQPVTNDALSALTASTYGTLQTSFFQTFDVKKAEVQNEANVTKLKDDAAVRIDTDFLNLGMTEADYTTIVNKQPVVDTASWEKVSSVDADGKRVFDRNKWSTIVTENILRDDATYLKRSGLTPEQYKPVVQEALIDRAIALDMPELLENTPTLYRSGKFDDKVIDIKQDIENFQFTEWSRNNAQKEAERKQNLRDIAADIHTNYAGKMIDMKEANKKGVLYATAANTHNRNLMSSTSSSQSDINRAKLASNLDRAILNGTAFLGLDGKPATLDGEAIDPMNVEDVKAYFKLVPSLHPQHRDVLIDDVENVQSKANLFKNPFMEEGLKRVEAFTKDITGNYYILGDSTDAQDEFNQLFQKHWTLTQTSPDYKGKDLRYDAAGQQEVMKQALSEWKELDYLFTAGVPKKDDVTPQDVKTDSSSTQTPTVTEQPAPEPQQETEQVVVEWKEEALSLSDSEFWNFMSTQPPTKNSWAKARRSLTRAEFLETLPDELEDSFNKWKDFKKKSEDSLAELRNKFKEPEPEIKMNSTEKAYFEKTGKYPQSFKLKLGEQSEKSGTVMNNKQLERYSIGLEAATDKEAFKQMIIEKGFKLPSQ